MCQPVLSIIIPMYNVSSSIERCLLSVLDNSSANVELLCVDDGSNDNTVDTVEKIAKNDKRVKILKNNHSGVSSARNTGLDNAKGKYIAFVDSDDAVEHNAFLKIESLLEKTGCDCLTFGGYAKGESKRAADISKGLLLPDACFYNSEILERALFEIPSCDLFIWNKVFSADIIQKKVIRFDKNISLGEDRAFIFDCFVYVNTLVSVSDKLYIYTADHENSITDRFSKSYYKKARSHLMVVEHIFNSWSKTDKIKMDATKRMLNWASAYVYRPRKEKYTDVEKRKIIGDFSSIVHAYYPTSNIIEFDEGLVIDI